MVTEQKALMGRRRGFPRSESRWLVRTGAGPRVDTGPGAANPNPFSRIGRVVPLQAAALLEAKSARRVTACGIRVVPRDMIYCAPDETSGAFFVPRIPKGGKNHEFEARI